eukprot:364557-Chlamydomonas_euryale.AAC.42
MLGEEAQTHKVGQAQVTVVPRIALSKGLCAAFLSYHPRSGPHLRAGRTHRRFVRRSMLVVSMRCAGVRAAPPLPGQAHAAGGRGRRTFGAVWGARARDGRCGRLEAFARTPRTRPAGAHSPPTSPGGQARGRARGSDKPTDARTPPHTAAHRTLRRGVLLVSRSNCACHLGAVRPAARASALVSAGVAKPSNHFTARTPADGQHLKKPADGEAFPRGRQLHTRAAAPLDRPHDSFFLHWRSSRRASHVDSCAPILAPVCSLSPPIVRRTRFQHLPHARPQNRRLPRLRRIRTGNNDAVSAAAHGGAMAGDGGGSGDAVDMAGAARAAAAAATAAAPLTRDAGSGGLSQQTSSGGNGMSSASSDKPPVGHARKVSFGEL